MDAKTFEVVVTPEDASKNYSSPPECPLARAIRRLLGDKAEKVVAGSYSVFIDGTEYEVKVLNAKPTRRDGSPLQGFAFQHVKHIRQTGESLTVKLTKSNKPTAIKAFTAILLSLFLALPASAQVIGPPDTQTTSSGLWSNPLIWSNGIPGVSDTAVVSAGHTVTLDQDATLFDLGIEGLLSFNNGETLSVRTVMVMPAGTLDIKGSGHVEFLPMPATDAAQEGLGLMVAGAIYVDGGDKLAYVRATHDIMPGDSTFIANQAVCGQWDIGDQIVIGSTKQKGFIGSNPFDGAFEENHVATITGIDGSVVTFSPATTFAAPGISANPTGAVGFAPIGNLTRPITFKSLDPATLEHRAHSMLMDGGVWDVRGASFIGMGRTDPYQRVHPTDNIIGRYAMHFHRITNPATDGKVRGCVIQDYGKWGISIHEGADCLVSDNVFFDGVGSAMVTERGNEVRNQFLRNLVIQVIGGYQLRDSRAGITILPKSERPVGLDGNADFAADGSGFWGRRVGNDLIGNIFCSCAGPAMNLNGYYSEAGGGGSSAATLPISPSPGLAPTGGFHTPPPGLTIGNEAVACWGGLWLTYSQGRAAKNQDALPYTAVYDDFLCWNISEHYIEAFHDGNIQVNNFVAVSESAVDRLNRGANNGYARRTFFLRTSKNYELFNFVLNHCTATGVNVGIEAPRFYGNGVHQEGQWGSVEANDCVIECYAAVYINQNGETSTVTLDGTTFVLTADREPIKSLDDNPVFYSYEN